MLIHGSEIQIFRNGNSEGFDIRRALVSHSYWVRDVSSFITHKFAAGGIFFTRTRGIDYGLIQTYRRSFTVLPRFHLFLNRKLVYLGKVSPEITKNIR